MSIRSALNASVILLGNAVLSDATTLFAQNSCEKFEGSGIYQPLDVNQFGLDALSGDPKYQVGSCDSYSSDEPVDYWDYQPKLEGNISLSDSGPQMRISKRYTSVCNYDGFPGGLLNYHKCQLSSARIYLKQGSDEITLTQLEVIYHVIGAQGWNRQNCIDFDSSVLGLSGQSTAVELLKASCPLPDGSCQPRYRIDYFSSSAEWRGMTYCSTEPFDSLRIFARGKWNLYRESSIPAEATPDEAAQAICADDSLFFRHNRTQGTIKDGPIEIVCRDPNDWPLSGFGTFNFRMAHWALDQPPR